MGNCDVRRSKYEEQGKDTFNLAEVVPFIPLHSQKAYPSFHTTQLVTIEAGWSSLGAADFLNFKS